MIPTMQEKNIAPTTQIIARLEHHPGPHPWDMRTLWPTEHTCRLHGHAHPTVSSTRNPPRWATAGSMNEAEEGIISHCHQWHRGWSSASSAGAPAFFWTTWRTARPRTSPAAITNSVPGGVTAAQ